MRSRVLTFATALALTAALCCPMSASAEDAELQSAQVAVYATTINMPIGSDFYEIEMSTGQTIDDGVLQQHERNLADTARSNVVASRDWTIYDDEYGLGKMTAAEQTYYHRLEDIATTYISDNTIDAYYVSSYQMYTTNGVQYSDLGVSRQAAINVTEWFIYNNPQYYFFEPHFLSSSSSIYIGCYSKFANGDDRAAVTNQVFGVMDGWIASISDDEVTAEDKIRSAHDLLCKEIAYVKGDYDQSVYSTTIQKQTVCAGYAEAMTIMLNAVGVDTTTIISDNHAWNLAKFDDGNYYAVDSTWDDILSGYQLFAVGSDRLRKYDSGQEHVPVSEWGAWSPDIMPTGYNNAASTQQSSFPAPQNLRPVYSNGNAYVTWDSIENATGYEVRIGSTGRVTSVTSTTVRLTNMREGQSFDVYVRAKADTLYSDWKMCTVTMPATTQPTTQDQTPAVTSLATPTLYAKNITSSSMTVYWNSVENATKYEYVFARDSAYSNVIATNVTASRSLNITGLVSNTKYYVRVRALATQNGKTIYSGWKTGYIQTKSDADALKPSNFTAKYTSSNTVKVTWTNAANANKCEIRVYDSSEMKTLLASKTTLLSSATFSVGNRSSVYVIMRGVNTSTGAYSGWIGATIKR